MREILFRAKRLDNGEWVEGFLLKIPCAIQIGKRSPWYIDVPPKHPEDKDGRYNVDPATVGQYTGLLDKNGKRIFEGDVVRIEHDDWSFDGETIDHRVEEGFIDYDGSMTIGLVVGQYNGIAVRSPFFHLLALTNQIEDWSIEVIGNIHESEPLEVTPDE